jgi:hypothetical protein
MKNMQVATADVEIKLERYAPPTGHPREGGDPWVKGRG